MYNPSSGHDQTYLHILLQCPDYYDLKAFEGGKYLHHSVSSASQRYDGTGELKSWKLHAFDYTSPAFPDRSEYHPFLHTSYEYIIVRGTFPIGQIFFQDHLQRRSHRHDLSLAVLTLVQLNRFILKIKVFDLKAQHRRDTVSSRQKIVGEHPSFIFVELAGFYIRLFEEFLQFGIRVGFLDTLIRFWKFNFEALEIPFLHQIIAETAYSPHIGLNGDVVTAPVLKIEDKAL